MKEIRDASSTVVKFQHYLCGESNLEAFYSKRDGLFFRCSYCNDEFEYLDAKWLEDFLKNALKEEMEEDNRDKK